MMQSGASRRSKPLVGESNSGLGGSWVKAAKFTDGLADTESQLTQDRKILDN